MSQHTFINAAVGMNFKGSLRQGNTGARAAFAGVTAEK